MDENKKIEPKELSSRRNWEAAIVDFYDEEASLYKEVDIKELLSKLRKIHAYDLFVIRELLNNPKYSWDDLKMIFIKSS